MTRSAPISSLKAHTRRENSPSSERSAARAAVSEAGVDQITDGFGLGQVELTVEDTRAE